MNYTTCLLVMLRITGDVSAEILVQSAFYCYLHIDWLKWDK